MKRTALLFTLLTLLTAALFVADLAVGSGRGAPARHPGGPHGRGMRPYGENIIVKVRLLKAVTALFAGAALACQRPPDAEPSSAIRWQALRIGRQFGRRARVWRCFLSAPPLLGVAGHSFVQSLGIAGAAWLGAALVLGIVMAVSRRIKDIMAVILILGMMLGSGIGSVVEILQYLSSRRPSNRSSSGPWDRWATLRAAGWPCCSPVVTAGLVLAVAVIKPLNLLLLGENYARTMGLNIQRTRTLIFLSTVLLAGTVTAFCGPWDSSDWPCRTSPACSSPRPTTASSCRPRCSPAPPCCSSATSSPSSSPCPSTPSRP